jgi:hypothetical protein
MTDRADAFLYGARWGKTWRLRCYMVLWLVVRRAWYLGRFK